MALELIGAGLGRTGTLSLKAALEQIGYGPCYHMMEILVAPERGRYWLEQTRSGSHDWDAIFRGYRATVDWPAAAFWRELVERYPDAKVLLTRRDSDRWYDSVMNTIYPVMLQGPPERAPQILHDFHDMVYALIFERTFEGRLADRAHAKRVFEEHNQSVIDAIPPSRLLVYQPGDGWEPICGFLGVPVPAEEFPHLNDTAWYRARTGLPAIEAHR
jgi:Sulfotransferase domain